jgi:hypothetical protein
MVMAHVECLSCFRAINEERVAWYHVGASDNRARGVLHVALHRWKAHGTVFRSQARVRADHMLVMVMICFGALAMGTVRAA